MSVTLLLCLVTVLWPLPSTASEPLVVAAASSSWWYPGCDGPAEECTDPNRALSYADDDAWRASYLLASHLPADRFRILASPDAETADRRFPAEPAGPATAEGLVEAVGELRGVADGPREVVIFLAAHGSVQDLHLDDGRHDFSDLRDRIEAVLRPDDQLLLITDVCWSGRWRGLGEMAVTDDLARFPAVQDSMSPAFEAVVEGRTPEDTAIGGGVFSYLVLSGLMGGADADGDGSVGALELSDFVHGYVAADRQLVPAIRVPRADPEATVPAPRARSGLRVGDADAARWLVLHADGTLLVEAFALPGEHRVLHLPPGDYRLLKIPVVRERDAWHAASPTASAWPVEVPDGGLAEASGTAEAVRLDRRSLSRDGLITRIALPGTAVAAPPRHAARYHASRRGKLSVGLSTEVGVVGQPDEIGSIEGVTVMGPTVRYARDLAGGRSRFTARLSAATDLGQTELLGLQPAGWEVDLLHGRHAALSASVGAHFTGARFHWADHTSGTVGGGGGLGLSAAGWLGHRWALRGGVDWMPTAWLRQVDEAGAGGTVQRTGLLADPDRHRIYLSLQRAL